ncbi:M61 family metallopeptidase [Gallaecimonas mangrovi]|uniref:M61 family metallopeptidase n=1 Tax=Gallaecimonas mangrovi TaxID=2291597 RepID=UPI001D0095F0|nr:M61 family peptidase [Gallaecimonas mangrovi]
MRFYRQIFHHVVGRERRKADWHSVRSLCLIGLFFLAGITQAQASAGPVQLPAALTRQVALPVDHPFKGHIDLTVNATDIAHQIYSVNERIPLQGSQQLTLLYPQFEYGSHGPSISVVNLMGLKIHAQGKEVRWKRDPYQPYAFHLSVPSDAKALELQFQIVGDDMMMAPDMVTVPWQKMLLYPAGWYARNINVAPTLRLPMGLQPITPLSVVHQQGADTQFATTDMDTLQDSPLIAGRYTKTLAVTPTVSLDLLALHSSDLKVPADKLAALARMVQQIDRTFGPRPFKHYDILVQMNDEGWGGGLEHRTSGENYLPSVFFRQWATQINNRDLITHEMVHAWNGLYRVPADMWAATPNIPVSGSLLWVYEGQTEFWGRILSTRAGLLSAKELRERLAMDAAKIASHPGRAWRPLSDDVNYPAFMLRKRMPWRDWQRRKDYYAEGVMLWLDVDAQIRALTDGKSNINNFAKVFFSGGAPDAPIRTYTFDDVCAALNAVAPSDWAGYLRHWLNGLQALDTNAGLERHGWKLVFTDQKTVAFRQHELEDGENDLTYSIGLTLSEQGKVYSVAWQGPAFNAGMRPGVTITAVNGAPFSLNALLTAVAHSAKQPVVLSFEEDGKTRVKTLIYQGGLRYPHLARLAAKPDTLSTLIKPL